jgi:hypothetical protein
MTNKYGPIIGQYPDLVKKVEGEIARTRRTCKTCKVNQILDKYIKIAIGRGAK